MHSTSKKAKGPRRGVPKPGGGVVESEASLRAKLTALDGREAALTKQLLALKREGGDMVATTQLLRAKGWKMGADQP